MKKLALILLLTSCTISSPDNIEQIVDSIVNVRISELNCQCNADSAIHELRKEMKYKDSVIIYNVYGNMDDMMKDYRRKDSSIIFYFQNRLNEMVE